MAGLDSDAQVPSGYILGEGQSAADVLKSTRDLLESEGLDPNWLNLEDVRNSPKGPPAP
jgi:hypothetical protein